MAAPTVKNPMLAGDGDPRHGSVGGYTNHACRCAACVEAWAIWHRDYMARKPEQRAKRKARSARWARDNRDRIRARDRARYHARKATPEGRAKIAEHTRRQNARRRAERSAGASG